MYKFHWSHRGSAMLVGLIIVILVTIMTMSFLDKVLNLGKISGGIDKSAQAYTLATGLIEEQLMDSNMTKQSPWNIATVSNQSYTYTGRTLIAATGGTIIPSPWKWNSSFSWDWNIIGMGDPVQIVIPDTILSWNTVSFRFRAPDTGNWHPVNGSSNSWVILWIFGHSGASLYASGETQIFQFDDIDGNAKLIWGYSWQTNTWANSNFQTFYDAYKSNCVNYQCTLKLSMIRPFKSLTWQEFPFLEYQIDFNSAGITVPSQYMVINSSSYIFGYLRSREVRIPQVTTNTATDFAVLQ